MHPLQPLELRLTGLHLIEASAGTGKTFALALLYLRLLLETEIGVDRILVVTFTQAATEELRDRIHRQLRAALQLLEGGLGPAEPDPQLVALMGRLADPQRAQQRLRDALARLDEAAIHTIHGFCHRMLVEYAFECGAPFDAELTGDDTELAAAAVADFWRQCVTPLDLEEARWVRMRFPSPASLLAAIDEILAVDPIRLIPDPSAQCLDAARRNVHSLFEGLRDLWAKERDGVVTLLQGHPGLNRRSYNCTVVDKAIAALDALTQDFCAERLAGREIGRFLPQTLREHTKLGAETPEHPLFDRVAELRKEAWLENELRRAQLLGEARRFVRRELSRRKAERRQLAYDDLLRLLDDGLSGAQGDSLAERIRSRFPAALIDEFQDTDPLQYRIFQRLYRGQPRCALFLIGDPKQAIYAFRGADLFTYLQARRDLAEEGTEHGLLTNWRSASALVRATNCLFSREGPAPFVYPAIPFAPVAAGPKADTEPLILGGLPAPPLELWLLAPDGEAPLTGERARELAAAACAARIRELLPPADQPPGRIGDRPLAAGDIAILVRTHREGAEIQGALRRLGIPSASRSRQSVFATEEARELALLLAAMAEPSHEGLVRAALVSDLVGLSATELDGLTRDELAWEAQLERFRDYRHQWLTTGVVVPLLRLLHDYGIPARLLARADGERRLTNLLQLGELLGAAAGDHPQREGLLHWLEERRRAEASEENEEPRLESDENLVQIVTQHKSKGLQYPVVFIPFPWTHGDGKQRSILAFHDPDTSLASAYLGEGERDRFLPLVNQEALAERLRLLYVAITRAEKLCVLYWGRVKGAERSALAYLLHPEHASLQPEEMERDLTALMARSEGAIAVQSLSEMPSAERWHAPRLTSTLSAPAFTASIDRTWRVVSYSGLVSGREAEAPDHDAISPAVAEPLSTEVPEPSFQFPRGIAAGHCLHGILERVDFPSAAHATLEPLATAFLDRFGLARHWAGVATQLALATLDTPLDPAQTLSLRQVAQGDRLTELEFHYPLAHLSPTDLEGVVAGFADYRHAGAGLSFQPAEGLMRGFIDLVFRHQGRYFLADYKSNHLGNRLQDYEATALRAIMAAHRYDLQALVYTLALHRYLGRRLPDYDYDQHFGGGYYLFLRGLRPQNGHRNGVCFVRPKRALIENLDQLFRGSRP